jgi:hypothetical protein
MAILIVQGKIGVKLYIISITKTGVNILALEDKNRLEVGKTVLNH